MSKSNEVLRTLAKFGVGDQEVALVREAGDWLREDIPEIINEFYE